jgi:hypothetical protein
VRLVQPKHGIEGTISVYARVDCSTVSATHHKLWRNSGSAPLHCTGLVLIV